ncbi:MAG: DNA recombination protein RmuC [Acidobacteriota bacterium]
MDTQLLAPFLLGLLIGGAAVGWWLGARLDPLRERLRFLDERLRRAEPGAQQADDLRVELAAERARREADTERLAWIHTAHEQLRLSFRDLARQVLEGGAADQRAHLRGVVEPLEKSLAGLDDQVRALEKERRGAYEGLRKEVELLRDAHRELHGTAHDLSRALRESGPRGRWGEVQLRRVVEMAGMTEHVDFTEQPTLDGGLRPDLVVHLPGRGLLPVDAKAPMKAYLEATEATDGADRRSRLGAHAKALRQRAVELGSKRYWAQFPDAPDFVAMFLPHEGGLSAAFQRDPDLLEFCVAQRVLPATPVTLLALLKSVAWGWREQRVAQGAAEIADAGRELYARLGRFLAHLAKLGQGLDGAASSYNQALGSLERRVLPAARRLGDAAAPPDPLPEPTPLETGLRSPTSGPGES